jgi:hypothetical protein
MNELEKLTALLKASNNLPQAQADMEKWLDETRPQWQAQDEQKETLERDVAALKEQHVDGNVPKEILAEFGRRVWLLKQKREELLKRQQDMKARIQLRHGLVDGRLYTETEIDALLNYSPTPEEQAALLLDGKLPTIRTSK